MTPEAPQCPEAAEAANAGNGPSYRRATIAPPHSIIAALLALAVCPRDGQL